MLSFARVPALVLLASLSGCGWSKAVTQAPPKGFVQPRAETSPGIITKWTPFQYAWNDPDYHAERMAIRERGTYSLFIEPIGIGHLGFEESDEGMRETAEAVAAYLRKEIAKRIREEDGPSYEVTVTETRDEADFVFEVELTEMGFGSPSLYVIAWVTPLPGVATAYDASHTSVIALEARTVETSSGRVVSEIYDRRIPKIRIFDLRKALSRTSPLRDICDDWADEIAAAFESRADRDQIEGAGGFTLIPW